MFKSVFVSCSVTIVLCSYAAEQNVQALALPTEIWDRILSFLPFYDHETEEEFVERTNMCVSVVVPLSLQSRISSGDISHTNSDFIVNEYCPNEKMIIISRQKFQQKKQKEVELPLTKIILWHIKRDCVIYEKELVQNFFVAALSHNAALFAFVGVDSNQVSIKNIISNLETMVSLPKSCKCHELYKIAFNKQSTQLIVRYKKDVVAYSKDCKIPKIKAPYIILKLTSDEEIAGNASKRVNDYFSSHLICKELIKQLMKS